MGDTFANHNNNSYYRNPTFYYIGTLDPLGFKTLESKRPKPKRSYCKRPRRRSTAHRHPPSSVWFRVFGGFVESLRVCVGVCGSGWGARFGVYGVRC